MTVPSPPKHLRRRGVQDLEDNRAKARFTLVLACVWPLIVLFFLTLSSDTPAEGGSVVDPNHVASSSQKIRNLLDRVDILGYGPTHPRVAVVLVGDDSNKMITSVKSIFSNTDLNRLFVVCAVMDGVESDPQLVTTLNQIDQGSVPHWHGLRPDLHKDKKDEGEDPHGKKVHALFSAEKQGIAASRSDAVDFIQLLDKKHVQSGLKSPQEDLILLLLEPGAELVSRKWLGPVTSALIVPPPLLPVGKEEGEENGNVVALKLANAVSFGVEGTSTLNKAISFDYHLQHAWVDPSAKDMALSNGASYPTPALPGIATALRLHTYANLPAQDDSLVEPWLANLDLALNLWLCADGIDVLGDVTVSPPQDYDWTAQVTPRQLARFAAAWMDDASATATFETLLQTVKELTRLEWDTMMAHARRLPGFPSGMQNKCRPFGWYTTEINMNLVPPELADEGEVKDSNKSEAKENKEAASYEEEEAEKEEEEEEAEKEETDEEEPPPPRPGQKTPSKPLNQARLEIISQAQPVELDYVDVSGGHTQDPHKGAKFENGTFGYVHDATALHKNPPSLNYTNLKKGCKKHDGTYKMLTQKVVVDFEGHEAAEKSGERRDKIFCLVYTISGGHPNIPAIRETWGQKCDGFMVGSNKTDVSIGAVNIVHEGPEEYNNIWQKVRSMWSYIYDNYYEEYDWFHIGGDDLYLIVENLRLYLESEEIRTAANGGLYLPIGDETSATPLFLGRRFAYMGDMNDIFLSGGSGYTMNKAALKALVVNGFPNYFPHAHTFSEDTMVARIFRKMGILPYDTKDEAGGERYMPFMPGHHLGYQPPKDKSKDWYAKYSIDIKYGLDHCAANSVAFHYVKGDDMKRLHALLYHLCPTETS